MNTSKDCASDMLRSTSCDPFIDDVESIKHEKSRWLRAESLRHLHDSCDRLANAPANRGRRLNVELNANGLKPGVHIRSPNKPRNAMRPQTRLGTQDNKRITVERGCNCPLDCRTPNETH